MTGYLLVIDGETINEAHKVQPKLFKTIEEAANEAEFYEPRGQKYKIYKVDYTKIKSDTVK